jgi:glycosyltransferase involved in cell wall biosynthesis
MPVAAAHSGQQATGARRPTALRILMGVPAPGAAAGGPALHLPMLVEDLRAAGHVVETLPFGRWRDHEPMPVKLWHQLVDLVRYPAALRRAAPDVVHLNSSFDPKAILRDVPFAFMTRRLGKPLFVKWHGSDPGYLQARSPIWRLLVNALLSNVDAIGVLSSDEAAAVRRRRDAPACHVVRNGLDLSRYDRTPDLRVRFGIPAGAPLLLFISRLIPTKGVREAVAAMRLLAPELGAHLLVVGDGPERVHGAGLASRLGVADRVHFIGRVPEAEAADFYCGSDILVFPTYHIEGFPMTVFQSLAGGLGVVTTRIRATADYLREPDNALFVPPRDAQAVATAVEALLRDPAGLAAMRSANRALARRFDRRTVAAEAGDIYDAMLGRIR